MFHPRAAGTRRGLAPTYAAQRPRRLFRRLPWEIRLAVLAPIYLGIPALVGIAARLRLLHRHHPQSRWRCATRSARPVVRILARDGSLLAERGGADAYVPIDLLPRHLIDAVVATEDRRFFKHWGLDPTGLARAVIRQPARRTLRRRAARR